MEEITQDRVNSSYKDGVLKLSGGGYRAIQPGVRFPEEIRRLELDDNQLSGLDKDLFRDLNNLKELYLFQNPLTSLDKDIFRGLTNLGTLNLLGNQLTSLDKDIFRDLTKLENLWLGQNHLTSLDNDIFRNLTKLKTLWLYENQLTSLDKDIFRGLINLKELNLRRNQLTSLDKDIFRGLTNLKKLNLLSNPGLRIPAGCLDGLPLLNNLLFDGVVEDSTLGILSAAKSEIPFFKHFVVALFTTALAYYDIYTDIRAAEQLQKSDPIWSAITVAAIVLPLLVGPFFQRSALDKVLALFALIYIKKPLENLILSIGFYKAIQKMTGQDATIIGFFTGFMTKTQIIDFEDEQEVERLFSKDKEAKLEMIPQAKVEMIAQPKVEMIAPEIGYGRSHYTEVMFESVPQFMLQSYILVSQGIYGQFNNGDTSLRNTLITSLSISLFSVSFGISRILNPNLKTALQERSKVYNCCEGLLWLFKTVLTFVPPVFEMMFRASAINALAFLITRSTENKNLQVFGYIAIALSLVFIRIVVALGFERQSFDWKKQRSLIIRSITSVLINSSWNLDDNFQRRLSFTLMFSFESILFFAGTFAVPEWNSLGKYWTAVIIIHYCSMPLYIIAQAILLQQHWVEDQEVADGKRKSQKTQDNAIETARNKAEDGTAVEIFPVAASRPSMEALVEAGDRKEEEVKENKEEAVEKEELREHGAEIEGIAQI